MDSATAGSHNPYPVTPLGFLLGSYIAVSRVDDGELESRLTVVRALRYSSDTATDLLHDVLRPIADARAGTMDIHAQYPADGYHSRLGMEVLR